MNVDETVQQMEKEGIIKSENLTHKPRNDVKIKKFTFWYNSTQVSKRWDGEIWYEDENNSHERLAKVSCESMMLFVRCAHNQTESKNI